MSLFQTLVNILYRQPKSKLKHYRKFGGYFNLTKIEKARKEMEEASLDLPPVISYDNGLPVYFLTGKKYLYQTLFCIQSISKVSDEKFKFYLVDDSSFTNEDLINISRLLPNSTIYTKEIIEKQLAINLPKEKYPYLHHKRATYPHLKKLTDVHIFDENPWKLVLDSDMLFWKQPDQLISWLKKPSSPAHMVDCEECYGYSKTIMQELCSEKIKPLVNVGAIGLLSKSIQWSNLENWCIELEKKEGVTYFLEQALSAMLIGEQDSTILNKETYVVNPQNLYNKDILHHYVDTSKELYFKTAWKQIVRSSIIFG